MATSTRTPDENQSIFTVRSIAVSPDNFDRLYGEIATFMNEDGSNLEGLLEGHVLGHLGGKRIVVIMKWRSHAEWSRAMWDRRLGDLLEEIALNSATVEFDIYTGNRFPLGSEAR
jgi:hypothetical protein